MPHAGSDLAPAPDVDRMRRDRDARWWALALRGDFTDPAPWPGVDLGAYDLWKTTEPDPSP